MQPTTERNELSTMALVGIGLGVLVAVAALVFIGGSVLTGGDDDDLATDGTTGATATTSPGDGSDADTDQTDGSGDDDQTESSDGNGPGQSDDSGSDDDGDQTTTVTTAPSSTAATGTTAADDSDYCEAGTRNNFDIRFAAGDSSSTVDSSVTADQVDLHNLEVNRDQVINVILTSLKAELEFSVRAPDGSIRQGEFTGVTIAPTQAGIYQICVSIPAGSADYGLTVSVIDDNTPTKVDAPWCGSAVNDRGEIRFATGTSSGEVENAVIRGERDLYTFDADAGQSVDLFLTSLEDNAVFDFRAPDGELLITEVSDFRLPLPLSGTYEICIGSIRGNASYTLTLGIG